MYKKNMKGGFCDNHKIESIMKKFLYFAVVFAIAMVIMPTVHAEGALYGTVEKGMGDDTNFKQSATANNETITVTYEKADLKWYPAAPEIGRKVDGWWVGINIIAPSGVSEEAKMKRADRESATGTVEKYFSKNKGGVEDSDPSSDHRYFGAWIYADKELLNTEVNPLTIGTYELDWNGDGDYEQKIIIQVNPKNVNFTKAEGVVAFTIKGANGSRVFSIKGADKKLSDLNEDEQKLIAALIKPKDGQKFVGYKTADGKLFDVENDTLEDDMVLTAVYEDIPVEVTNKSDTKNPDTADINLLSLLALIIASGLGLTYSVKKVRQN